MIWVKWCHYKSGSEMSVIIQHVRFCLFGWRDRRRCPDFFCFMFTYYIYTQEKCELILWHLLVSWIWHTVLLLLVNFPFPPFPLPWSFFNLLNEKQDISTQDQPHWTWNFPNLVELDSRRREQFVFTFFPARLAWNVEAILGEMAQERAMQLWQLVLG